MAQKAQVQTELTSKKIKSGMALAVLAIIAATGLIVAGVATEHGEMMGYGVVLLAVGLPVYGILLVARWWCHK